MITLHFEDWDDGIEAAHSVPDMADDLLEAVAKLEAIAASLDKPEEWPPSEAARMPRYLSGQIEDALTAISDVGQTLKRNEFTLTNQKAPAHAV